MSRLEMEDIQHMHPSQDDQDFQAGRRISKYKSRKTVKQPAFNKVKLQNNEKGSHRILMS